MACFVSHRVVIVTDTIYPFVIGGKEHRLYQIAVGMANENAEILIYTTKQWNGPRRVRIDGIEYVGITRERSRYIGARRKVWQALMYSIACLQLLTERFDVVDVDSIPLLPVIACWVVARLRRRPMVVTFHEAWSLEYWRSYCGDLLGAACAWTQLFAIRRSDVVIAASEGTARFIAEYHPRRLVTIENAVDVEMLKTVPARGPWSDLICVGRLVSHKRVELAIKALRVLTDQGVVVRMLILGTGPEEPFLRSLAADLGLADSVVFQHPWKDRKQFISALKSTKVMVMPSSREGFGISVLEALASGIPVVMADDAANLSRELVGPGDLASIVPPTAHSFASAIQTWLQFPGGRQSNAGVDHRSWSRCARDTLDVYVSLRREL